MKNSEKDDLFQVWLIHMDDAIQNLIDSLPDELGGRLDYSGIMEQVPQGYRVVVVDAENERSLPLDLGRPKYSMWHKEHFESASPVNWPAHVDGRLGRRSIRRTLSWHPTL